MLGDGCLFCDLAYQVCLVQGLALLCSVPCRWICLCRTISIAQCASQANSGRRRSGPDSGFGIAIGIAIDPWPDSQILSTRGRGAIVIPGPALSVGSAVAAQANSAPAAVPDLLL
jgi:hypothetical protein